MYFSNDTYKKAPPFSMMIFRALVVFQWLLFLHLCEHGTNTRHPSEREPSFGQYLTLLDYMCVSVTVVLTTASPITKLHLQSLLSCAGSTTTTKITMVSRCFVIVIVPAITNNISCAHTTEREEGENAPLVVYMAVIPRDIHITRNNSSTTTAATTTQSWFFTVKILNLPLAYLFSFFQRSHLL